MKIKTGFLILVILLGLFLLNKPLYSQSFHGGPLLGFSATQVDGDTQSGFNKFGGIIGGFVNQKLSENIKLQFELKYIQKGSRQSAKPANGYQSWKIALNYVEIPLLVKYSFNENRKKLKNFVPEAGLAVSYLTNYSYSDQNGQYNNLIKDNYHKFDYGILAGISYKLGEKLSVNLRYSYSILSVYEPKYPINPIYKGQFNKVLAFTANYQF
ncbi:MAG: PorT family protein [Bacteroidetes bacterium]|nr:PorT family protein [Bacteroidota bacterium]